MKVLNDFPFLVEFVYTVCAEVCCVIAGVRGSSAGVGGSSVKVEFNFPKVSVWIAISLQNDFVAIEDFYVLGVETCFGSLIAKLANGKQGTVL